MTNSRTNQRIWTARQTDLRKLITAKSSFDAAIALFLNQHAAVHSEAIAPGTGWSLQDEALEGLSEEQIRRCPPKTINSIAWLLWHAARIEDITMTALVFEQQQVLDEGDWAAKLGLPLRDTGAGMTEEEVRDFSARVNIPALVAYRNAVGSSTRARACNLAAGAMKEKISQAALLHLEADGSISARAPWLTKFYSNRPRWFFLTRTATSHNFLHINQAWRMRAAFLREGAFR